MTAWQLALMMISLTTVILGLGLLLQLQPVTEATAKELMIEVEDNDWTIQNESATRPAVVISEQEDGSVIVETKQGKQRVANYDSMDSMMAELDSILEQMPNWNFTK